MICGLCLVCLVFCFQPTRGGSVRSGSVASYVAGGKRGSSASAISATSEKGELVDTFSKLNVSLVASSHPHLLSKSVAFYHNLFVSGPEQDKQPAVDRSRSRTSEGGSDLHHIGPLRNPSQDDWSRWWRIRLRLLEARHASDFARYDQ